ACRGHGRVHLRGAAGGPASTGLPPPRCPPYGSRCRPRRGPVLFSPEPSGFDHRGATPTSWWQTSASLTAPVFERRGLGLDLLVRPPLLDLCRLVVIQ